MDNVIDNKIELFDIIADQNSFDDIFSSANQPQVQKPETVTQVAVAEPLAVSESDKKKTDLVFIIQVILIIVWLVLTVVTYFFGYSLLEPFINVN